MVVEKDKNEGNEEEGEKGAFPFVNGKPETEKRRKKPRTVVMDGVLLACWSFFFSGDFLFVDLVDHSTTTTSGLESVVAIFCLVAAS